MCCLLDVSTLISELMVCLSVINIVLSFRYVNIVSRAVVGLIVHNIVSTLIPELMVGLSVVYIDCLSDVSTLVPDVMIGLIAHYIVLSFRRVHIDSRANGSFECC